MPRKTLDLRFPAAGVVRRHSLHSASDGRGPYPSPWAVNVRLEDVLTKRLRGGSFAGISAATRPSEILYRDRVLTISGAAIVASRMGDHDDTSFASDVSDTLRAKAFQLSLMGETGGNVVALVPHKDQSLVCFTAGETWVQQGDPYEAPLHRVSDQVGIIGADAWCVAHDTVYFLSSLGMYSVGVDGSGLQAISEDRLPSELVGVSDSTCTLTYQHSDRGVYIHTTGQDWYYDIARQAFWPFDASTAQSHVLLGPIRIGSPGEYGRILRLFGVTAESSADVTWRIVVADSAEGAADNGKLAIAAAIAGTSFSSYHHAVTGTWSAGINNSAYPRARSQWMVLWLAASSDWAFEAASVIVTTSGRWK